MQQEAAGGQAAEWRRRWYAETIMQFPQLAGRIHVVDTGSHDHDSEISGAADFFNRVLPDPGRLQPDNTAREPWIRLLEKLSDHLDRSLRHREAWMYPLPLGVAGEAAPGAAVITADFSGREKKRWAGLSGGWLIHEDLQGEEAEPVDGTLAADHELAHFLVRRAGMDLTDGLAGNARQSGFPQRMALAMEEAVVEAFAALRHIQRAGYADTVEIDRLQHTRAILTFAAARSFDGDQGRAAHHDKVLKYAFCAGAIEAARQCVRRHPEVLNIRPRDLLALSIDLVRPLFPMREADWDRTAEQVIAHRFDNDTATAMQALVQLAGDRAPEGETRAFKDLRRLLCAGIDASITRAPINFMGDDDSLMAYLDRPARLAAKAGLILPAQSWEPAGPETCFAHMDHAIDAINTMMRSVETGLQTGLVFPRMVDPADVHDTARTVNREANWTSQSMLLAIFHQLRQRADKVAETCPDAREAALALLQGHLAQAPDLAARKEAWRKAGNAALRKQRLADRQAIVAHGLSLAGDDPAALLDGARARKAAARLEAEISIPQPPSHAGLSDRATGR